MSQITDEFKWTDGEKPQKTEYEADVLVVGGGFAGLFAALTAAEKGANVVLVDKGRPGFSGQTPFAGGTRWYDPEKDESREVYEDFYLRGSEYLGNPNWIRAWLDESKSIYEKFCEYGLCEKYPDLRETEYDASKDYAGYCAAFRKDNRHLRFVPLLSEHGVTVVDQTMIYDVLENNNRVTGAVGFHVPTGTPILFKASAVILCMGGGVFKTAGYFTGGISFDVNAIAYRHFLPVTGMEFEDFHFANPDAPSNSMRFFAGAYVQSLNLMGGSKAEDEMRGHSFPMEAAGKEHFKRLLDASLNGAPVWGAPTAAENNLPKKPEQGPAPRRRGGPPTVFGAAPGLAMHTTSGIWCGENDLCGFTGLDGLYCAGDGSCAGPAGGAIYVGRPGFTSNFCALQGKHAGEAAAKWALENSLDECGSYEDLIEEMTQPLRIQKGYDPGWALDCLQGIMAPLWTSFVKSEERLKAALVQVEYIRDRVLPRLCAVDSHGLRNCIELKNKVLSAEMKLRAGLARKESRGGHYREDYPFHDDANGLCYYTLLQGHDGTMEVHKVQVPNNWVGDLSEPYAIRYERAMFPGEADAAVLRGWMKSAEDGENAR